MSPRSSLMRRITTAAYKVARAKAYRDALPSWSVPAIVELADQRLQDAQKDHAELLGELKGLDMQELAN